MDSASRRDSGTTWIGLLSLAAVALAALAFLVPRERLSWWLARLSQAYDYRYGWERLPPLLGAFVLAGLRGVLRQRNLYDTSQFPSTEPPLTAPPPARYLTARSPDGTYNDLGHPRMGARLERFGRNVPHEYTYPEAERWLLSPNPRTVSRELMTRREFRPATTLNVLAAAWLQFMVHDWLSHGPNSKENPWKVELAPDDTWPEDGRDEHGRMTVLRAKLDATRPTGPISAPPTFINEATHWWDGSQLYGSDESMQKLVRSGTGGKLKIDPSNGLLEINPDNGLDLTGVAGNYWIGLSVLHTLFTLEHNAICDRLRSEYPNWSDDDLFDHARLINAALMAKIHTVEWTPGILGHPTLQIAMRGNWWGIAMERIYRLLGRISESEVISGIPGSSHDHHAAPYSITEEFVAVYRMHPLMPDDFDFYSVADHRHLLSCEFPDVAHQKTRTVLGQISMPNALYSLGIAHPGQITLHNFPRSLQQFTDDKGNLIDLAAVDILRIRERGVPRYNDFRALLHRPRVTSFEELTDNSEWVEEMRRVYDNDVDRVDLTVGLFAEPLPPGFGFSDTAFRIFILMASRRLKSDRFFTDEYNARIYTQLGLDWIDNNNMSTVLLRHYPSLRPSLRNLKNAFAPWNRIAAGAPSGRVPSGTPQSERAV